MRGGTMGVADELRKIRQEIALLQEQEREILKKVERIIYGCRSVSGYPHGGGKLIRIKVNDERVQYVYEDWHPHYDKIRSINFPTAWLDQPIEWCQDRIREIQRQAKADAEIERIKKEVQKQVDQEDAERALLATLKAKYERT